LELFRGKTSLQMPFYVFLSHSSADETAVEEIARRLAQDGIQAWLDKWNLIPGDPWQPAIENALAESGACAVFVGPSGFAPWQIEEMRAAIDLRVRDSGRRFRVIPVFLPGAEPAERSSLPRFLAATTWVEFRSSLDDKDAFHRLICGIRGISPGEGPKGKTAPRLTHNLPFRPNPAFTGRDAELKDLRKKLRRRGREAAIQVVVLHGLGGVGKTQLAVEYAWKYLRDYNAELWVKADTPESLEASLAALCEVLRLPESSEHEQAIQIKAMIGWLETHDHWLLIADNADIEPAAKAVGNRFAPNLSGHVLITSRISEWPVNIQDVVLDPFSPDDATRYLLDRVARRRHNAGDQGAARLLAQELGNLPLALEQAASFIIEMRWSFAKYLEEFRDARPELINQHREGGTRYPASVAKTWSMTLDQLSSLARTILRIAAWLAPDAIPRDVFSANKDVFSEALGERAELSDIAIDKALGELDRFSLIRLTTETVSVHLLLQAVEQDSLGDEERKQFLLWGTRLLYVFAPESPDDVRTWDYWLPLWPHADTLLEHAKRNGVDLPPIAVLANLLGVLLQARAVYAQAEPLMRRALEIDEKHYGSEHSNVATDLNTLAALLQDTNRLAEAEPLYRRALAIDEKSFGADHPKVARDLNNLAVLLHETNRLGEAEPLCRRALAIDEKSFGPDHPKVAIRLSGLAGLLRDTNWPAEAEPLLRRALKIDEKHYDLEHPTVATRLNNLALLLKSTNRLAEAEPLYRRALAIDEKSFGPDHPNVARDLNNLAGLLHKTSRLAEAEPLYRRALAIDEKSFGPDHPNVAIRLNNLAELLRETKRLAEAEPLYRRALAIDEKSFGPDHPSVARDLNNLAGLLRETSRLVEAEPLYRQVLRILAEFGHHTGREHPHFRTAISNYADLLAAMGLSEDEILARCAREIEREPDESV
jgi:tetratricopeptide (TPR) repeat protein